MEKKFKHEKIETCLLCKKPVETDFHDWVALIDYDAEEQVSKAFYHRKCLTDLIQGQGEVIRQKFEDKLRKFTGSILKGVKLPV